MQGVKCLIKLNVLVVRIWCIIILGVRIRSHWNTATMIASISLHVSLQRSSMIYMYMFSVCIYTETSELQTIDSFKCYQKVEVIDY